MTGLAMANWRRLDHNGTDRCTLSRLDHGWMLSGQAKWLEKEIETSLIYAVRCDEDWSAWLEHVRSRKLEAWHLLGMA